MQKASSDTFTQTHSIKTAVLFLVFNRPDTTKQVFEEIRKAKPPRLYVAADGPRAENAGEAEKVEQVRRIATQVDWDCEVKSLFREKNLGCRVGVSSAIDWFFENEEMGIILEDDCLPNQSFFRFCQELLHRYKDDERIMHVAGTNFMFGWQRDRDYSYYFSHYGSIWGWATWRRAWKKYDVNIGHYPEIKQKGYLLDILGSSSQSRFKEENFNSIMYDKLNTWDYQWMFARYINCGLSIVPEKNMVSNIGFGSSTRGSNTRTINRKANMQTFEFDFPLRHPFFVIRDKQTDDRFFTELVRRRWPPAIKHWLKGAFLNRRGKKHNFGTGSEVL